MAIVPMQKVAVVAHKSEKETLLDLLHKEGVMEITDVRPVVNVEHAGIPYRAAELDHVIAKLTEIANKQTLAAASKKVTEEAIRRAALEGNVRQIIDRVHALEEEHGTLLRELHELEHGRLPAPSMDVNAAEEGAYFTSQVREDLSHYGGQGVMSPKEEQEQVTIRKAESHKRIEENRVSLSELSKELPTLLQARIYVGWLDEQESVRQSMKSTRSTVTLFGWVAKHLFEPLERKLENLSPATALVRVEPAANEQAPVLLKNSKLIAPFESVTALYGLPQPHEIDPTPLLAPFFILFFGLCLTDAGYGIVLAAIMGAYIFKKKLSIKQAPLWWLLFLGGIFTFLVSIPFGGWFGLTPDQAPAFMTELRGDGKMWFKGQIWNLGETPGITFFQNLSLILGLIHLSFGIFMSGFMKWRGGDRLAAFMNDWTALILFGTIASYFFLVPAEFKQQGLYAIYGSIVLLVIGRGWGSKWYLIPVMGLLGVLNLAMSMLSNTLSYLRLLALGLVTGALALAVNLVAQQLGALFPAVIGIPVAILIYIVGHTANVALNTLGAFIHSGRLQFVEFFGNFFEGGGRPYQPFKRTLP